RPSQPASGWWRKSPARHGVPAPWQGRVHLSSSWPSFFPQSIPKFQLGSAFWFGTFSFCQRQGKRLGTIYFHRLHDSAKLLAGRLLIEKKAGLDTGSRSFYIHALTVSH